MFLPTKNEKPAQGPRADRQGAARLALFTFLVSLLLAAILVFPFLPGTVGSGFREGMPAPATVLSPVEKQYVSESLTERDREANAAAVAEVYRFDPGVSIQKRQALSDTLAVIEAILYDRGSEQDERELRILQLEGVQITTDTLPLLLNLPERDWPALEEEVLRLYDSVAGSSQGVRQIREGEIEVLRASLAARVRAVLYSKRTLIAELVGSFLVPNYVVDDVETEQRREQARANTPPHYVIVQKGQRLIAEGDIVETHHLEVLEAVGLLKPKTSWPDVTGRALLVVGLMASYSVLLYRFQRRLAGDVRRLVLLGLLMAVALLGAKLVVPGRVGFAYAFPLPTASILLTLLLGPQVALGGTIVLAVLVGLLGEISLVLVVLGIVGGLVGIVGIWRAQRYSAFMFTGLYVTFASMVVVGAFHLISGDLAFDVLLTAAGACAVNGFASIILSFATFNLLGTLFGQVTVLQLMELSNPNHPLLRRLMQEAPGTYHHSIIVGNLAERAAEVIGADPLLARVGAYYHDIGKLVRPYFFSDNQAGRSNVHDELPPRSSAQIITEHVKDGLALARRYRLPEQITQFISQHHGTRLATFFYRRALQEEESVDPEDFRYPGPKPQSREAAILMLADSVEATVRSMSQSGKLEEALQTNDGGEDPLAELVEGIIDERVREGQLDECDLTFRDLRVIERAFADMLRGVYHPRVAYPELGTAKEATA